MIIDYTNCGQKYDKYTDWWRIQIYMSVYRPLTLKTLKYVYIKQETKGFFQFEIIMNVLFSFFRFI